MRKMAKQTVWVVTSGQYSDYSLEAVCSTEEIAQSVAALIPEANGVFEMEIDALATIGKRGKKLYMCWCKRSSAGIESPYQYNPGWHDTQEGESIDGGMLRLWIWAKDQQSALKIANERRARWLAGDKVYPKLG